MNETKGQVSQVRKYSFFNDDLMFKELDITIRSNHYFIPKSAITALNSPGLTSSTNTFWHFKSR